jgi:hypothetical protein
MVGTASAKVNAVILSGRTSVSAWFRSEGCQLLKSSPKECSLPRVLGTHRRRGDGVARPWTPSVGRRDRCARGRPVRDPAGGPFPGPGSAQPGYRVVSQSAAGHQEAASRRTANGARPGPSLERSEIDGRHTRARGSGQRGLHRLAGRARRAQPYRRGSAPCGRSAARPRSAVHVRIRPPLARMHRGATRWKAARRVRERPESRPTHCIAVAETPSFGQDDGSFVDSSHARNYHRHRPVYRRPQPAWVRGKNVLRTSTCPLARGTWILP